MRLHTIIASTRPGRAGPSIAKWFHEFAKQDGKFDAQLIDLADFKLPLYDEPHHPMRRQYAQDHTKAWSASVTEADALVFVLPEYNFSPPPSFMNALDYLFWEWQYKPVGFVSYGGISGGVRAAQAARLQASTLKMSGPCAYTGRDMYETHKGLHLTNMDFNAVVEDLQKAMDKDGVPFATQNRFLARLAPMQHDIVTK
ncbi:MAG TPA: NAD(P)H-dependent oxidoreductase [Rhizomicrobium sp.]|jgi:NAD(P)H-dependent FMN reductase